MRAISPAARELAAFMEASLFRDGALMACLCGGVLKLPAQLDDLVSTRWG